MRERSIVQDESTERAPMTTGNKPKDRFQTAIQETRNNYHHRRTTNTKDKDRPSEKASEDTDTSLPSNLKMRHLSLLLNPTA
jgi:hypothetical protein